MNWQEIIVFGTVALAALYSSRVFLQQFEIGEKKGSAGCATCPGCALTQTNSSPAPRLIRIITPAQKAG